MIKRLINVFLILGALFIFAPTTALGFSFSDNQSNYPYDGECDDPRFIGLGMASILVNDDIVADKNDCRMLFQQGNIEWN